MDYADRPVRKKKRGNVLIGFGLLLIAAALCLVAYNVWDADRAYKASNAIAEELIEEIDQNGGNKLDLYDPNAPMPTITVEGYEYIGILEVPVDDLQLPVMMEWDYDRLKISPCRYTGSYYSDDLVICGHNYAKHFSPLKWIDIGADVYFTNVEGETIHYTVTNRETVQPTAVSEMVENMSNSDEATEDWDLTLFTCNTGGQTRCAVRCKRVED